MSDASEAALPDPIDAEKLAFDDKGLIPAIVQDAQSGEVLMLAWQSREALDKTLVTGKATFYSRSRQTLWVKGETSGNVQSVQALKTDCDADAVLMHVEAAGPACHTGARSCFFRGVAGAPEAAPAAGETLLHLERVLAERQKAPPPGSYTAKLFASETTRHKKIGEEATELVIASLKGTRVEIAGEAADLVFHAMVLLRAHGMGLSDVAEVLRARENAPRRG